MISRILAELKSTDKATFFQLEGVKDPIWIPKKAFKKLEDDRIQIFDWMAKKKGLIGSEPNESIIDYLKEILSVITELRDLVKDGEIY
jgi:hypothetical protein